MSTERDMFTTADAIGEAIDTLIIQLEEKTISGVLVVNELKSIRDAIPISQICDIHLACDECGTLFEKDPHMDDDTEQLCEACVINETVNENESDSNVRESDDRPITLKQYPDSLTWEQLLALTEKNNTYTVYHTKEARDKAAQKINGQIYTLVDGDNNETIFSKGRRVVNACGEWIVIKLDGYAEPDNS